MDPKQIETFRNRLEKERQSLVDAHEQHEQNLREGATTKDIAGADRAVEHDETRVSSRIVESEEFLLEKIGFALQRIQEGTYGICETCNKPIPFERLEAKPSVSLCVPCQEAKDAGA